MTDPYPYRSFLFDELVKLTGAVSWKGRRILEIGPRDGRDTKRLEGLKPDEIILLELPEKSEVVEQWLPEISVNHRIIYENFAYLSQTDLEALGHFDLIWCTGVLYHNAEQLRFLRKLYRRLSIGGYLVLESATLRGDDRLVDGCYVEVHYPEMYRGTRSMTHLPTAKAIKAWLAMVGFRDIVDSQCFEKTNPDLVKQRMACICRRTGEDDGDSYYKLPGSGQTYIIGDST